MLLTIENLTKSYAAPVLRGLNFQLAGGEVHALVGSNGAGKSTMARIIAGLVRADAGSMALEGQLYAPRSKNDASESGVVMVHQELNIIPTLTVAENLFLDRLPSLGGFIQFRSLAARAREALSRVGLKDLDPSTLAGPLSIAEQQLVEIAAALDRRCRVLILDEPTAALSDPEIGVLFENIRRLRSQGVGILYISHRMDEIREIADRVTVLRDGTTIATHPANAVEPAQLVREMAGHELDCAPASTAISAGSQPLLRVTGLSVSGRVHDVSLIARAGEIVGIAGLAGSGRSELLRGIYDGAERSTGEVWAGAPLSGGPQDSVEAGVGFVPEDRKSDGLFLTLSVNDNVTISSLTSHSRLGWIQTSAEGATTWRYTDLLGIRCASPDQPVAQLSGGNQQKVLFARWLARDCQVLLLDEPTRGVDAAARDQIYALLRALAAQGKCLLVVSSDLPELMSLSHRILVISAGRLTGEFLPGTWSREAITRAAFEGYTSTLPT